jgi:hypothetical protein
MGGGSLEAGKYDVTVEPEAFSSAASEQIGRFWQLLTGKLKSGGVNPTAKAIRSWGRGKQAKAAAATK